MLYHKFGCVAHTQTSVGSYLASFIAVTLITIISAKYSKYNAFKYSTKPYSKYRYDAWFSHAHNAS